MFEVEWNIRDWLLIFYTLFILSLHTICNLYTFFAYSIVYVVEKNKAEGWCESAFVIKDEEIYAFQYSITNKL